MHGTRQFTKYIAKLTGKSATFALSILLIVVWLLSGPFFHYSDTWQLAINTSTTIITFIMVFCDSKHAKSRHRGDASEARRANSRHQRRA